MTIARSLVTSLFVPTRKCLSTCTVPFVRRNDKSYAKTRGFCTSRLSHSANNFTPPSPPSFTGTAVFADVDFSASENTMSKTLSITRNRDPEAVFVVTGASRGIGLRLVEVLQHRTKGTIIACCRSPETATRLQTLARHNGSDGHANIEIIQLDLENPSSMESMVNKLTANYTGRIVALFNVAGILGDGKSTPGPERSITKMQRSWLEKTMNINFIGPLLMAQALVPLMRRHSSPVKSTSASISPPTQSNTSYPCIIVSVSARVGSISDNNLGGWISYRCSKAALNQATRTMAHELKRQGIIVATFHPGTTDTDLSKPFQGNVAEGKLFPVEFTVDRLLAVSESMDITHSGGFYDWGGKALPF